MNKEKIVEDLDKYINSIDESFNVEKDFDGDLNCTCNDRLICWFTDFKKSNFHIDCDCSDAVIALKKGIIYEFYRKAVPMLEVATKYTIQIMPNDYGFLYKPHDDDDDEVIVSELVGQHSHLLGRSEDFKYKNYFTEEEIEKLKANHHIAIDWDKAVIREVDDDNE